MLESYLLRNAVLGKVYILMGSKIYRADKQGSIMFKIKNSKLKDL